MYSVIFNLLFIQDKLVDYSEQVSICAGHSLLLIFCSTNVHPGRMHAQKLVRTFLDDIMSQLIAQHKSNWTKKVSKCKTHKSKRTPKPLLTHFFADHVADLHIDSDIGFSKEYDEIQKFSKKVVKATHEHSANPENKSKNRYLNIVACKCFLSNKNI